MDARTSISAILGVGFALGLGSAETFAEGCSLAPVLAMDASKSMDSSDFELEFHGTAAALRSAEVQAAILGQAAPVALSAFEWSGQNYQQLVHDWSILRSREDIEEFASALENHERGGLGQKTGMGSALDFSYALLEEGPGCVREVVDISSDGYSSDGMTPGEFYAGKSPTEVTVNALVVGGKSRPHLWDYFTGEVIHGPGAFSLATIGFSDYPRAIKKKLLRELSPAYSSDSLEPFVFGALSTRPVRDSGLRFGLAAIRHALR
ncbi:DUF1194 domain-containing protein [Tropicimonas sp. IMCC6043]|uniref:DUF1194 domain-containing protein n=1 Tax=Tropicimonas sp. IMCC6043 TaxID=2510645 RepID=UPI00101BB2BF|nr:DUF1194 domain-containing protein [Tropicimonas sp. IMCC6043]RYH10510.1 DUF1194 domain-containing protein [Tropicimonas sp. IMCC6043]